MKILLTVLVLLTCIAIFAKAPFTLPTKTKVINQDKSGKTWQMNAYLDMEFEKAKKLLSEAVQKSNFKLKHEIVIDKKKKSVLLSWIKNNDNLLIMIWQGKDKKTYFAWGISKI